jgi:hypothetical protein
MIEVEVAAAEQIPFGTPHTLFELDPAHYSGASRARSYDLTSDASRFVFVHESYPPGSPPAHDIQVIQNWFAELKARAPSK